LQYLLQCYTICFPQMNYDFCQCVQFFSTLKVDYELYDNVVNPEFEQLKIRGKAQRKSALCSKSDWGKI